MARPSRAVIDLEALRHNYAVAQGAHGAKVMAVLKADAYGHGAVRCAKALHGLADGLAVAFADEALSLWEAGIRTPTLVLEGPFDAAELEVLREHGTWIVVHQESQVRLIESMAITGAKLQIWLKVDTGMHRAGFPLSELLPAYSRLRACPAVDSIGLMTHFARADEPSSDATIRQVLEFDVATKSIEGPRSLCNSAGILAWPQAHREWGRCGIALYGADPLPFEARRHLLRPVMSLESHVFSTRLLQAGDAIGYGAGFIADRPMRVGLVAIGYADGYPRSAPSGTPVSIDGQLGRIVGRVSMDMLSVDLSDLPEAGIGSRVELWGKEVDVNLVARHAGTISYELLCNVKRVRRLYQGEDPK